MEKANGWSGGWLITLYILIYMVKDEEEKNSAQ